MSVESRLREATSELEGSAAQTTIPQLSTRKSRSLPRVLVGAAGVAGIVFLLSLVDLRPPTGFVPSEEPLAASSTIGTAVVIWDLESMTPVPAIAEETLEYINELREDNGISPLAPNDVLQDHAILHSVAMASNGTLAHSDIGDLLGPFSIVGENVGFGQTWASILDAHAGSPDHYTNMTDTRFTDAGVGVYLDPAGTLWLTMVFATP